MKKKLSFINILLVIIFFFTIFLYIGLIYKEHINNDNVNKSKNTLEYDLEYCKKMYSNNDIIGKLKIEGTSIDTLLVKSTNNEYYLNHDLNKKEDIKGSIFVDYRTNLNSKQINIYGHNSLVHELPFKELEKYKDRNFYKEHNLIELWNGVETIHYKIFSIQIVTSNSIHIDVNPKNVEKHINKLNESIYETNEKATVEDKILILQTCDYSNENAYLLIIAKKI